MNYDKCMRKECKRCHNYDRCFKKKKEKENSYGKDKRIRRDI